MRAHAGLCGALRLSEALVGRKSGVYSEVFYVRLEDVHYVHLARQLHQLQRKNMFEHHCLVSVSHKHTNINIPSCLKWCNITAPGSFKSMRLKIATCYTLLLVTMVTVTLINVALFNEINLMLMCAEKDLFSLVDVVAVILQLLLQHIRDVDVNGDVLLLTLPFCVHLLLFFLQAKSDQNKGASNV